MSSDKEDSNPPYVLGHSDHELGRLRAQAQFLEPVTRQFLREAGITPGMRMLDVGSGAGEVAFLVAELLGDAGIVLGTEQRLPHTCVRCRNASRAVLLVLHKRKPFRQVLHRPVSQVVQDRDQALPDF